MFGIKVVLFRTHVSPLCRIWTVTHLGISLLTEEGVLEKLYDTFIYNKPFLCCFLWLWNLNTICIFLVDILIVGIYSCDISCFQRILQWL